MIDPITTEPTQAGGNTLTTRVWLTDHTIVNSHPFRGNSIVAAWLVEAPWAHPIWHSYIISVIHLRPGPGCPPATIVLADATHEIAVYALDPAAGRQQMLDTGLFKILHPVNFVAQMKEESDAAALERAQAAVDLIVAGWLSPDTDFTRDWITLFGDNMLNKPVAEVGGAPW